MARTPLPVWPGRFTRVETLAFDYGQRHRVELDCRAVVRSHIAARFPAWTSRLHDDHLLNIDVLGRISDTALTSNAEITLQQDGLPNTFVPGRNLLFFTLAAALAYRRDIAVIVGGMCETDYSGYPDCRDTTVKAMQVALTLGMGRPLLLETPLMWLDKAATWQLAQDLGGDALVDIVREDTHTCYLGQRGTLHAWGHGCGACPACVLRGRGHARWQAQRPACAVMHQPE